MKKAGMLSCKSGEPLNGQIMKPVRIELMTNMTNPAVVCRTFVATFSCGILAVMLWLRRTQETKYKLFLLCGVCWFEFLGCGVGKFGNIEILWAILRIRNVG